MISIQAKRAATLYIIVLGGASAALAEPGPPPRGARRPPPEAFTACQGKSKGEDCQVALHDKTLAGVCVLEDQTQLFCFPNDMPAPPSGGGPGGPPPEQ